MADLKSFLADDKVNRFLNYRALIIIILGNVIRFRIVFDDSF